MNQTKKQLEAKCSKNTVWQCRLLQTVMDRHGACCCCRPSDRQTCRWPTALAPRVGPNM